MKATGIVRRIDELGRVVIPKEIRRTQRIRRGDPLEIFTTGDGEVIFKKYSPIGEMNAVAAQYTEVLSKSFALTALVADRDRILTVSGSGRRELADRSISQPLEKLMDGRRLYQSEGIAEKCILPCEGSPRAVLCAAPIIAAPERFPYNKEGAFFVYDRIMNLLKHFSKGLDSTGKLAIMVLALRNKEC